MTQSQSPYDSVTNTNLGNTRCGRCGEWGHNRRTCVGAGSVMSPSSENNVPLSGGEKVRVSRGHKKKKGTQSADEDGDYSPEAQEEDGGAEGASVAAVKSDGSRRRRETGPTAPRCVSAWQSGGGVLINSKLLCQYCEQVCGDVDMQALVGSKVVNSTAIMGMTNTCFRVAVHTKSSRIYTLISAQPTLKCRAHDACQTGW